MSEDDAASHSISLQSFSMNQLLVKALTDNRGNALSKIDLKALGAGRDRLVVRDVFG